MTKIFYVYRYWTDQHWSKYTPSHTLQSSYPEWNWLYTINDEKIQTNIEIGKRLWWVECDLSIVNDVATEIQQNWLWAMMKYITNDEAVAYMQAYTNYPESPARTFELSPAWIDEMTWLNVEARYLIIE